VEAVRLLNVLYDVDLLLDVLLTREPWVADAWAIWTAHHRKRLVGHIAAHGLMNLFYVVRKVIGTEQAREAVRLGLQTFEVIAVGWTSPRMASAQIRA